MNKTTDSVLEIESMRAEEMRKALNELLYDLDYRSPGHGIVDLTHVRQKAHRALRRDNHLVTQRQALEP